MIPVLTKNDANAPRWESVDPKTDGGGCGGIPESRTTKGSRELHAPPLDICQDACIGQYMGIGWSQMVEEDVNRAIERRREWPSRIASEQWTNVPKINSASFLENFFPCIQVWSLRRYWDFLSSGMYTVFSDNFQIKPRYLNSGANGLVFEHFQGQPSWAATSWYRSSREWENEGVSRVIETGNLKKTFFYIL